MTQTPEGGRSPALDVIRCVACFCVISVHSCIYTGFYAMLRDGGAPALLMLVRIVSMCCVPLFMLLSGYLLCHKTCSAAYYRKAGKTVFIYIAASLFCVYGYPFLYTHLAGLLGLPCQAFAPVRFFRDGVLKILDFSAAPYAWYVEMYLGLFLIVPFLNLLYEALATKKQKTIFLLIGILLTILPRFFNALWHKESADAALSYQKLLPQWWAQMYPLTYYFLGCCFREYRPAVRPWKCLAFASGAAALVFLLGRMFPGALAEWCEWNSPWNLLFSASLFLFFLNLDYSRVSQPVKRALARLSDLALGAYLVSWAFDGLFYPAVRARVEWRRAPGYVLVLIPLVFVCSLCVSFCISSLYRLTAGVVSRSFRKRS